MTDQAAPQKRGRHSIARLAGWVLAGLLVLVVIAVIAAAVLPWNFLKGPITDRVESATGRELEIRGDVSVGILPRPHLVLEDLAFANADWADAADMATVGRLEVTPSLTSLVRGEPVIDDLEMTEPVINLQARDEEPGNWVLPAMQPSEDQRDPAGEQPVEGEDDQQGLPVTVREIRITDGRVNYLAPGAEAPHVLALETLTVSENQVSVEGEASLVSGDQSAELPFGLEADVKLGHNDSQWALDDLEARLADTRMSGSMGLDLSGETPLVNADLHSPSIDVPALQERLPESPEPSKTPALAVPPLPDLAGDLQLTIGELVLPAVTLADVEAHIQPGEHELTLEKLRFDLGGGEIVTSGRLTSTESFISAEARGQVAGIDLHALGLGDGPGHRLDAELALALERLEQGQVLDVRTLLEHLEIAEAEGTYRTTGQEPGDGSELEFTLGETGDPPAPVLSVSGRYEGKDLELDIEGAPMGELADDPARYRLQAHARSGDLLAWADTRLGALLSPATFAGNLVLEGNDARGLEQWIGPVLPPLPRFRVSGRVSRDQNRWSVTALDGTIGATELSGEVHYTHASQPAVSVQLDTGRIEIAQFLEEANGDSPDEGDSEADGDTGRDSDPPLAPLRAFDGELDLTTATLVLPGGLELQQLQANASLETGNLDVGTLRFDVAGGSFTGNASLDATSQPASGSVHIGLDDIALSHFGDTFTTVEDRLGRLSGEVNLDISGTLPDARRDDLLAPYIGRLDIQPSELHFTDAEAGTDFALYLETEGRDAAEQTFHIDGEGEYDGTPFALRFRGDPLLDARDPDRPYALEFTGEAVNTRIQVQGTILRPLALEGLDLGLKLEGPTPQRLTRLIGTPLPDLPAYSVSGDLSLQEQRWLFSNITGRAGDSDLSGRITLDAGASPPHIEAELSSSTLDIKDLTGLLGADPDPPAPQEEPADSAGDEEVLPDEDLATPAWQYLSADARYRADTVQAAGFPLSNVEIDFTLEDGHARFDPVRFGVGDGRVDFNLDLDSRPDPPEGTLQLEVQGVDLRQVLRNLELANDSVGIVAAEGKFWLTGASLAELLASADGGLVLLMTQGRLDALLVELAGLDASQTVLSWLRARDPVPIDCAYADLQTRDGVAHIDTLAIDTEDTTFTGTGTVNMATEELDITIAPHPKDVSVFSGRTPLHLGGTFGDIQPGLNEAGLATRLGSSAVLAAVAGPVAALLPLLDLGTGDEVPYCEGLMERSREAINEDQDTGEDENNDET